MIGQPSSDRVIVEWVATSCSRLLACPVRHPHAAHHLGLADIQRRDPPMISSRPWFPPASGTSSLAGSHHPAGGCPQEPQGEQQNLIHVLKESNTEGPRSAVPGARLDDGLQRP